MSAPTSLFLVIHAWAIGERQRVDNERFKCAGLLQRLLDTVLPGVAGFQVTVPGLQAGAPAVVLNVQNGFVDARAAFDGAESQHELYESWRKYVAMPSCHGLLTGNVRQCRFSELLVFLLLRGNAAADRSTLAIASALIAGVTGVIEEHITAHAVTDLRTGLLERCGVGSAAWVCLVCMCVCSWQ